jgi:CHAD domain-containing protein
VSTSLSLHWQGQPTRCEPAAVLTGLAPITAHYQLRAGARRVRTATYLDTADWRLRRQGLLLSHEVTTGPGCLVLNGSTEPRTTELAEPPVWPARAEQLAPGPVRDGVAPAMWIRAVAPKVRSHTVSRDVAVLNEDGKTVVRIEWAEATGAQPEKTPPLVRVTLRPVRGYDRDGTRVAQALLAAEGFAPTDSTVYEQLLRACGIPEGDTRPELTADMPADTAIATALLRFADAIQANLAGTIDDIDTEYLHDLRVAVRRTRSLIKIAGDVLPSPLADRFAPRFKWVGDLTTPTRDLDVYLLELHELAGDLTVAGPAELDPFGAYLHQGRQLARRSLVHGLRSQRFGRLLTEWRAALDPIADSGGSPVTAGQLAAERLRAVTKRVLRRASAITPDSPAEDVHALRKRCKELRYTLEAFRPLCAAQAYSAVLKDLKRLQDVLGAFQDGEVQSTELRRYAQEMLDREPPPAATLLAMGELLAHFVHRQHDARHELTAALHRFLGPDTARRISEVLP